MLGFRRSDVARAKPPRVMIAEVESHPLGDGQALLHNKSSTRTVAVSQVVADLATTCRHLDTVAGHLERHFGKLQVSRELETRLTAELTKLVDDGFFRREEEVLDDLAARPAGDGRQSIESLCFPTCDRVRPLRGAIRSYLANARHYGRNVGVVIADDSQNPNVNAEYRAMLGQVKSEFCLPVFYAGPEDKLRFAARVAKHGGLPEEAVRFALLGHRQLGVTTVGANRNTLLLQTLGQLIVQVDDDTRCVQSLAPHATEEVKLTWQANPMEATFFGSREDALAGVGNVEQDFLKMHENWLASFPSGAMLGGGPPLIDTLDATMLQRLASTSEPGRIRVSVAGSLGDCSWDDPHTLLFQPASVLTRIAGSEESYREARVGREVAQAARQITIAATADPLFAMCVGLDNTDLLPPFTPVGRAEEIAFAILLHKGFDNSLAVFLPWTIQHLPSEKRSFRASQKIGLETCVMLLLDTVDTRFAPTPARRLQIVGDFFSGLSQMSDRSFENHIRSAVWQNNSQVIQFLEERIADESSFKQFQIRDMAAHIKLLRQEALIPVRQRYAFEGGCETLKTLISSYGKVLEIWPNLIEASRQLQKREIGIARQL